MLYSRGYTNRKKIPRVQRVQRVQRIQQIQRIKRIKQNKQIQQIKQRLNKAKITRVHRSKSPKVRDQPIITHYLKQFTQFKLTNML